MALDLAASASQSNGHQVILGKVDQEFKSLFDRISALESEKLDLKEKLKKSESEKSALTPQLLAKFHQESKDILKLRQDLKSKHEAMLPKVLEAQENYLKIKQAADEIKNKFDSIEQDSISNSALLFAKVDLFVQEQKDKSLEALEIARKEKSKAENERQAADDLLKRANDQLQKIQDNGKSVLEKIAKAEKEHSDKLKILSAQVENAEKEKANLEKELLRLSEIAEKRKKLEAGLK